jgi:hypothetical protein
MVESPDGQFARVDVTLEQGDRSHPVFTLAQPTDATVRQETAERIYIIRPVGKRDRRAVSDEIAGGHEGG